MAGKTILVTSSGVLVRILSYVCIYVLEYLYAPEARDSERIQQRAQKASDEFST